MRTPLRRDVPIAIVGMACRFPGGVDSPAAYWDALSGRVDAVTEVPSDRFGDDAWFDADPAKPGTSYSRWGGFLESIDTFDAAFFGISRREAKHIDPQHRLLLEVAWEALEDGGQVPDRLAGTNTGVFVGVSTRDYVDIQVLPHNRHRIDAHINAGTAVCMAANRLSYLLDVHGPSFSVDTACSSSLTAVHLACRSLAAGESDAAIACGVNVMLAPEVTIAFAKASMLSPTGRCRAFDAGADGFVRGEGCGAVVLKPLERAIADRDQIHAVIRGSAINQDGRTNGVTVPNEGAQRAMIQEALDAAGVAPSQVRYVEAHGTGTPVGDPIEARAIGTALAAERQPDDHCVIGSAKTNLGHLEAAAGIAGLIKAVLTLKHRRIPPNLHFAEPNPDIPFQDLRLRVPTELEPWPSTNAPRLAGVNSFGVGGANAHVVLEEPPPLDDEPGAQTERSTHVLTLSARSTEALGELAYRHRERLVGEADVSWHDYCFTAATRRGHHRDRLAVVARTREEAIGHLAAYVGGEERAAPSAARMRREGPPKLAFVFCGMGPQWWAMGEQLLIEEPTFRMAIEEVDELLYPRAGWSLIDELARGEDTSRVADADVAHVANLAVQLGLSDLWREWGIVPDAVVGHSSGEMAAACVAGALTREDAVHLAYHRGRLQHRTTGTGRMLAAAITPADAERIISGHEDEVALAAINGPNAVTFSGSDAALGRIAEELHAEHRYVRYLPVQIPYHGPQMQVIRDEFQAALRGLRPRPADIPIVSIVTGDWIDGRSLGAGYWWQNVRQPVLFAAATDRLAERSCEVFVEIGPHPVLAGALTENLASRGGTASVLSTLRRGEDESRAMLDTLADLYVQGRDVRWQGVYSTGNHVMLPSYPWQRERLWFDDGAVKAPWSSRPSGIATGHPLLGNRLSSPHPTWEAHLDAEDTAYLDAHVVQNVGVYPGAGYLELALAAARQLRPEGPVCIEGVEFHQLLFLGSPRQGVVRTHYQHRDGRVEIHGQRVEDESTWTLHATARVVREAAATSEPVDLQALRERCDEPFSVDAHYGFFERRGYDFGDAFRTLRQGWLGPNCALATISFPPGVDLPIGQHHVHPALLDGALQLFGAVSARTARDGHGDDAFFPVSVRRLTFHHAPGTTFWAYVAVRHGDGANVDDMEGDAWLLDDDGNVALTVEGLRMRVLEDRDADRPSEIDDWLYELRWEVAPLEGAHRDATALVRRAHDVASTLEASRGPPEATADLARYLDVVDPLLDSVTEGFVLNALEELGWTPAGDTMEPGAVVAGTLDVVPRHRRLCAALVEMVRANQTRGRDAPPATERHEASLLGQLAALAAADPHHAAEAELLRRGGTHLIRILRGELDARDVLLDEEGLGLLTRFYTDSPAMRRYHELLADAIEAAVGSAEDAASWRVLEIGAGTGAATEAVLPRLPPGSTYAFTDISPFFRDAAERRFAAWPSVRFATLDIEMDPEPQGFDPHSFDLIVAADVLHATKDLDTTLAHVRGLLAEGGLLALMETTRRSRWLNLVFGLLDGWWRFADQHRHSDGPMIAADRWSGVLEANGFSDVTSLFGDASDERRVQTVQLAHARPIEPVLAPASEPATPRHWVVFADAAGVSKRVAESLERRGDRCTYVRPGEAFTWNEDGSCDLPPQDEGAYRSLLEAIQEHGALHGVLHMWSLRAPHREDVGTADLMAAQALGCGSVRSLMWALDSIAAPVPELWLVTGGAQAVEAHDAAPNVAQAALWGLGRSLMSEHDAARCWLLDIGPEPGDDEAEALAIELSAASAEEELALRGRTRFVRRLHRLSLEGRSTSSEMRQVDPQSHAFRLEVGVPGAIDSVLLRASPPLEPGPGEIAIRVLASGLNFRDVLQTLDMLPPSTFEFDRDEGGIGGECAGIVLACGEGVDRFEPGDEVIALASAAHGSRVIARENLTIAKPASMTFHEAASILVAYLTVDYALNQVARIVAGDRVLIHAATGGVGLAALQICKDVGAEVFATAGTPEKRDHLRSLGITHVMDSRSLAFADEVLRCTDGEGVDVVLNSLSGEATRRGLSILRPHGRFIELGKRDLAEDVQIGLSPLQRNRAYHTVDLMPMTADRPDLARRLMERVVSRIAEGTWDVLPVTTFDLTEAERALRLMAQAKHIGKVVLTTEAPTYPVHARSEAPLAKADGTYLITGGLGGLGLSVADWLVRQGAGAIVLMSRSGEPPDGPSALDDLRAGPAQVRVVTGDVSDEHDVERVLDVIRHQLPPLRAVFHAAMVLDDDRLVRLDQERFERVLAPKMAGAWNLHRQTLADELDHFVLFSSVAAVLSHAMQASYAAANAFLDALASQRRGRGLPGMSIAWGALADVGYVARYEDVTDFLARRGFDGLTREQAHQTLDALMRRDVDHVMAAMMNWRRWSEANPLRAAAPRLRHVFAEHDTLASHQAKDAADTTLARLRDAEPHDRLSLLRDHLTTKIARILDTTPDRVDPESPFTELGFDSLMAVELGSAIRADLDVWVPVVAILQDTNAVELAERLLGELNIETAEVDVVTPGPQPSDAGEATSEAQSGSDDAHPLSFEQRRFWFQHRLDPDDAAHNLPTAARLSGRLDRDALKHSLTEVLRRHEILRAIFDEVDGEPVQRFRAPEPSELPCVDLRSMLPVERPAELARRMTEVVRQPFDVRRGPLLRARLFCLDEDEHVLLLVVHHIVCDAWAMNLIVREVAALYEASTNGDSARWAEPGTGYLDYVRDQHERLPALEAPQLSYWRRQLANASTTLGLPEQPMRDTRGARGAHRSVTFSAELTAEVEAFSRREGVTPFMTLLAAFKALLHRFTGATDVCVGTAVSTRRMPVDEAVVGCFINTLALRSDVSDDPSFRTLLARVRRTTLDAFEHQDVPFDRVVEAVRPARSARRTPLFEAMLVLHNARLPEIRVAGLGVRPEAVERAAAVADLALVLESAQQLTGMLEYDADRFDPQTVDRLLEHFRAVLESAVADPEQRLSAIHRTTEAERQLVVFEWNDTTVDLGPRVCLHHLVEDQVDRTPHAVAVVGDDTVLTYADFEARANRLAHYLRGLGIGPNSIVGAWLPRSPDHAIAALAVLKAGGTYLPLDPAYPVDRIRVLLADSRASVVLGLRPWLEDLRASGTVAVAIDSDAASIAGRPADRVEAPTGPDDLAYILYTSGSTGKPKGVQVPHRAIVNHVRWRQHSVPLTPTDAVLQGIPVGFDPSVWEVFGPLSAGARLVVPEHGEERDAGALVRFLGDHGITAIQVVPSMLHALLEHPSVDRCRELRLVFCGGEPLPSAIAKRFSALLDAELHHLYGPTEATIDATHMVYRGDVEHTNLPIGRPIANGRVLILDERLEPVPIGVPGEIFIGGTGVARGYHGQPDLTAERFIDDPFLPGERLYRSGDRGRWLPDGTIAFVGRIDRQVKVRGVRTEPGELESVLNGHPAVREAAAVPVDSDEGVTGLAALVTTAEEVTASDLAGYVAARLPEHLVPVRVQMVASLPRTATGKLDTVQAAKLASAFPQPMASPRAPGDDVELELLNIWQRFFPDHRVAVTDDFFDLGGHSLLAMRVIAQVERVFGQDLPVSSLLESRTIERLADVVRARAGHGASLVAIRPHGRGRPFFLVHPVSGTAYCYAELAAAMGDGHPLYGIEAAGLNGEPPRDRIEAMARDYVELLGSVQREGPYLLGGWSMGGLVAYEMARLIEERGSSVALLTAIDAAPPTVGVEAERFEVEGALRDFVEQLGLPLDDLVRAREDFWAQSPDDQILVVLEHAQRARLVPPGMELPGFHQHLQVYEANVRALQHYAPGRYGGRLTLIEAQDRGRASRNGADWDDFAAGVARHAVPGNHVTLLQPPHVEALAQRLQACLAEAAAEAP